MRRMLSRLMPQRLAPRFALLLVAALVAVNALAGVLVVSERARMDRAAEAGRIVERLASLVPLLEAVPPDERQALLAGAREEEGHPRITRQPLVRAPTPPGPLRRFQGALAEALEGREVRVGPVAPGRGEMRSGDTRHGGVGLSVRLTTPPDTPVAWLNLSSPTLGPGPRDEGRGLLWGGLGLSLVAVVLVALAFVHRLTGPLRELARAARAAGRGDRSVRVREGGAREVRDAAHAFNDMQTRIARFDAERTRVLAAVGHDLRTPITSLRIRAELIEDADTRDPMVRLLDEMQVMAEGLLAYARGERDAEDNETLDLADLLSHLCEERGAVLQGAVSALLEGRPVALRRAFGNLIDNALRYGGGARVSLGRDGGMAVVRIEDEGPGIAEERLEAMLEPFVRGESSRGSEHGGAGLGLSIAHTIIGAHGGELDLANREGGGLRVTVRLPLA